MRAYPVNELEILYTHTYPNNFYPLSIFIEENFMTVFGHSHQTSIQNTKIFVYDVENKGNPTLIHMYEMEGTYLNGRKT
jgi:inhibitor of cysteine peptidase